MSMSALCASRVSWTSTGSAWSLISMSRWLPLGDTGTVTFVILPSLTVISTCTGPQRVAAESPVYVLVPAEADLAEDEGAEDEGAEDAEGAEVDDGSGGADVGGVVVGAA